MLNKVVKSLNEIPVYVILTIVRVEFEVLYKTVSFFIVTANAECCIVAYKHMFFIQRNLFVFVFILAFKDVRAKIFQSDRIF